MNGNLNTVFNRGADPTMRGTRRPTDTTRRLLVGGVTTGPCRPHYGFSRRGLRRLTTSVGRFNIIRPMIIHGGNEDCRLITNRHHLHTTNLTKLAGIPTVIGSCSSTGVVRVTLVRGVRHRSLGPVRRTRNLHHLVRRFGLARRRATRGMNHDHDTIAGVLHLLGLPRRMRGRVVGNILAVNRTGRLLKLPGARRVYRITRTVVTGN